MRASDIGGVGGPAATPAPGPSPQRHRLPLSPPLPAPPPGICGGGGAGGNGEGGRKWGVGGGRASDGSPPIGSCKRGRVLPHSFCSQAPKSIRSLDELLSSFEVKPLEGQTQSVYLVKALPVNMHREPVLLISQHSFVPHILSLETRVGKLKISRPQKWRGCLGISLHVRAADILQESKIRENWIPNMDGIANCSTDVHTNLAPQTPLLLNTICPGQVRLLAKQ
jgi:hypothetical protein